MYEMYPDVWQVSDERHPETDARPRRRVRKEHSVVPAALHDASVAGAGLRRGA